MIRKVITVLFAASWISTPALAGDIQWNTEAQTYRWTSSECQRPVPPQTTGRTNRVPSDQVAAYEASVKQYITCIAQEVQADFEAEQQIIFEAVSRDVNAESLHVTQQVTNFNAQINR